MQIDLCYFEKVFVLLTQFGQFLRKGHNGFDDTKGSWDITIGQFGLALALPLWINIPWSIISGRHNKHSMDADQTVKVFFNKLQSEEFRRDWNLCHDKLVQYSLIFRKTHQCHGFPQTLRLYKIWAILGVLVSPSLSRIIFRKRVGGAF